jgi:hypothetical protein
MVEYRRKLEEYTKARQKFDDEASAYWKSIADKRRQRNAKRRANQVIVLEDYVLTQPPVYSGPPQPVDPSASGPPPRPPREYVPVVADFLKHAAEQFNFVAAAAARWAKRLCEDRIGGRLTKQRSCGSTPSNPAAMAATTCRRASNMPRRARARLIQRSVITSFSTPTASSFWPRRATAWSMS